MDRWPAESEPGILFDGRRPQHRQIVIVASPRSSFAGCHVHTAARHGADETLGLQYAERLFHGPGRDLVLLHEGVDGWQRVTRSNLSRLDHVPQQGDELQVDGLIAEMINAHPARVGKPSVTTTLGGITVNLVKYGYPGLVCDGE